MPFEVKDGMDIVSGGGMVGGVVALITSIGWWIRKEKSESAKNRTDVALSDAATKNVISQSEEIEILRKRITEQDLIIANLRAVLFQLERRISVLETGRDIALAHLHTLDLCDVCKQKHKSTFDAIFKALDPKAGPAEHNAQQDTDHDHT